MHHDTLFFHPSTKIFQEPFLFLHRLLSSWLIQVISCYSVLIKPITASCYDVFMMLVDVFIKKLQNKRFSGKVNQRSGLFPVDNGALDYFRGLFVFMGKFFCSALCF